MSDDVTALFRQVASNMTVVANSEYPESVGRAIDLIYATFVAGGKLLVFGNGGSSADAQHFTAELVGRFVNTRRALPAIALTTNQAILTAWSNDYSFDDVFARQIDAIGLSGDVAFGISTSGTSPNVVNALERARARGLKTIGLSAGRGGRMASFCDVLLAVPIAGTARIQEVHLATYHAICAAIDARIAGAPSSP
jgi:D-sedoheptulose 7-phosphate isomerase